MICKSKKIDENEVYNKAKKLLEIYRDVCWETSEYADQVRENLMVDYGWSANAIASDDIKRMRRKNGLQQGSRACSM